MDSAKVPNERPRPRPHTGESAASEVVPRESVLVEVTNSEENK